MNLISVNCYYRSNMLRMKKSPMQLPLENNDIKNNILFLLDSLIRIGHKVSDQHRSSPSCATKFIPCTFLCIFFISFFTRKRIKIFCFIYPFHNFIPRSYTEQICTFAMLFRGEEVCVIMLLSQNPQNPQNNIKMIQRPLNNIVKGAKYLTKNWRR